jgi:hypothetical protein
VKKNFFGKLLGLGLFLLSTHVFASDVGMIGESSSAVDSSESATVIGSERESASTPRDYALNEGDDFKNFFVHVDSGVLFRDLKNNSGLFCLDTSASTFGTACSSEQSWKNGKQGFVWSSGIGFRYNAAFSLDFAYWGLPKQSTTALTSNSDLALRGWLITGLYQAQLALFSRVFLMPQVGVAYLYGRSQGINSGNPINAKTVNWRPAVGLGILTELCSNFALNLSGLYVPGAGHSPTFGLRYPSIEMLTLGIRYEF